MTYCVHSKWKGICYPKQNPIVCLFESSEKDHLTPGIMITTSVPPFSKWNSFKIDQVLSHD